MIHQMPKVMLAAAVLSSGMAPTGAVSAATLQAGDLDPSFGTGGVVWTDLGFPRESAVDVAVQEDGKIVVAGRGGPLSDRDFALARYNADGSLDPSFGMGGIVQTDFSGSGSLDLPQALALQPDGKILVAGSSDAGGTTSFALVRYEVDGSLDPSFGTGGTALVDVDSGAAASANDVAVQGDGRIVVAGETFIPFGPVLRAVLARLDPDGSLDPTFAGSGVALTNPGSGEEDRFQSVAIGPDGSLVAGGSRCYLVPRGYLLARYTTDGAPDTSFGSNGLVTGFLAGDNDGIETVTLQPDGLILVGGDSAGFPRSFDFALARFEPEGSLDPTFGSGGVVLADPALGTLFFGDLVLQGDGKIIAVGQSDSPSRFCVARYLPDGSLDPSFGDGGIVKTDLGDDGETDLATAVTLQADGKIVVVGLNRMQRDDNFGLARYFTDAVESVLEVPTLTPYALAIFVLLIALAAARLLHTRASAQ